MTRVYGNSGSGGTTGMNGGRLYIDYTYVQNVSGGYTDVTWNVGFDYGDPNWWHNLSDGSATWTATTGTISSGTSSWSESGFYFGTSSPPNPGGDNAIAGAGKTFRITHDESGEAVLSLSATTKCHSAGYTSTISVNVTLPDISTTSTADPPTGLAPSGTALDAGDDIVFTWVHNPTDGTVQSKYQLQYKVDAGSYTTVGPTTSSTISYTLAGGTLTNGHTITWHVASAGENGTLSSYSADSTFDTSATPTVSITAPTSTYESNELTVEWDYAQAQSSPQVSFQAFLYDADDALLEQISGTNETSGTFTTRLTDATDYTVKVKATSDDGLTSDLDTQAFTTDFLPPADIAITSATFDPGTGTVVLVLAGDAAVTDVTEDIVSVDLQRRIGDGDWITFATGITLTDLAATVLDTTPAITGTNDYRAVAFSDVPSSVTSDVVTAKASTPWCFLSSGPANGFATVVRMQAGPQVDRGTDVAKALYQFAGRTDPVELAGEAVDQPRAVAAVLMDDSSTEDDVHALAKAGGVVCWRDPFGARVFASLSGVKTSRTNTRTATVSFNLTVVDYVA